nr:condensation domain-containing protein [Bacteroidota bacterium]
ELRRFLQAQLPAYLVPAALLALPALPLTASGKLDRRALPPPVWATGQLVLPASATEDALLAIWESVLGRNGISTTDNFFDIGGNSLKAVRILARVQEQLGRQLGLAVFFQHPSVQVFASVIDQTPAAPVSTIAPVAPAPRYAVSRAQKRLWIMDQLEVERAAYNIIGAYELPAHLDAAALAEAVRRLVARHEILRTYFIEEDGQPYQHLAPADQSPVALALTPVADAADFDAAVRRALQAEEQHEFNLDQLPLLRLRLLSASGRHVLLLNLHHIVGDGWSVQQLLQELAAHYAAASQQGPTLPALPMQYKDYAAWHNQLLTGEAAQRAEHYWLAKLDAAPERPELPLDFARTLVRSYASATLPFELEPALATGLRALCQAGDASLFMGLQALVKAWLTLYLPGDLTVGTTTAGRELPELAAQIGCYVNVLALHTSRASVTDFTGLLAAVRQDTLAAFEHQHYPFDLLVEKLQLRRDLSRNLLFDVMLTYLDGFELADEDDGATGLRFDDWQHNGPERFNKYDLTLAFQSLPSGAIAVELTYSTDLFRASSAAGFGDDLLALARRVVQEPRQALRPAAAPQPLAVSLADDFA